MVFRSVVDGQSLERGRRKGDGFFTLKSAVKKKSREEKEAEAEPESSGSINSSWKELKGGGKNPRGVSLLLDTK